MLSKQRTTRALIILGERAGWSAPLLFAYDLRHVFSWPSSHKITPRMCFLLYLWALPDRIAKEIPMIKVRIEFLYLKWIEYELPHPPSLIRVFAVRLKKPWVQSYPLSTQRRLQSDYVDAQADLSLHWVHRSFCWFCRLAAHMSDWGYVLHTTAMHFVNYASFPLLALRHIRLPNFASSKILRERPWWSG